MVHAGVLVLNKSFLPVQITTVRRAFCLLYAGIAKAVNSQYETFDFDSWRQVRVEINDDAIGLVDRMIKVPRVILLLAYDRVPKRRIRFSRHNIFARDKNTCQYCGKVYDRKDLNLDHVIPRDRGGPTSWENIVCSCVECNTLKANRTPQEAGMHLIRKPKRPKWRPFVQINFGVYHHDSWKHFVDLAYWNVELGEDVQ